MSAYDIYCCYHGDPFATFADVMKRSAEHNCDADVHIQRIGSPPNIGNFQRNPVGNAQKVAHWNHWAQQMDRPTLFIDADTVICNTLDDIWHRDFDVAYCTRPHRCPIIGGVVFARPTDNTKTFFRAWANKALELLLDYETADTLMDQYGGLSQACLNMLTKTPPNGMRLMELPAQEWNCCDQVWDDFDEDKTRIIHLKGRLRRACLTGRSDPTGPHADLAPLTEQYCKYLLRKY